MSFQERMEASALVEDAIIERLLQIGWKAFKFGQAQLPLECRDRLKRFQDASKRPSLIRWMPDIITFRDYPGGRSSIALIDAKTSNPKKPTNNWAIEKSAVETAEIYTDYLFTPTFFAFPDFTVLTPREARQRGIDGPFSRDGSGTPYILVAKRFALPFEHFFPPALSVVPSSEGRP